MPNVSLCRTLIQSRRFAFGCFALLILNNWAAPSYQVLDLSLAVLPRDGRFLIADVLSFEVGLSFLANCLPLFNPSTVSRPSCRSISRLSFAAPH